MTNTPALTGEEEAELGRLAQAVLDGAEMPVPGTWFPVQDDDGYWSVNATGDGKDTAIHNHITFGPLEATHRFIAYASPDRILRLLRDRARDAGLRAAAESAIGIAEDGNAHHSYAQPAGIYFRAIAAALRAALDEAKEPERA